MGRTIAGKPSINDSTICRDPYKTVCGIATDKKRFSNVFERIITETKAFDLRKRSISAAGLSKVMSLYEPEEDFNWEGLLGRKSLNQLNVYALTHFVPLFSDQRLGCSECIGLQGFIKTAYESTVNKEFLNTKEYSACLLYTSRCV